MPTAEAAERRRRRRTALLDAAGSLLTEGGPPALTFPALAERTGLATSAVHEHFPSRAALVEELCARVLLLGTTRVAAAMDAAPTPRAKAESYVRAQLALTADERHRAVLACAAHELNEAAAERAHAALGGLLDMLVDVLGRLGHEEPRLVAGLLQGVVDAAVRHLGHPGSPPPEAIADLAARVALDGVSCLPGDGHAGGRQQPGGAPA
ncbi:TetR family transcriptional regulator [Streptomyces sp. PT12]|nr:TetR family transcriptional regulator [Streptomyces sp. PT12]